MPRKAVLYLLVLLASPSADVVGDVSPDAATYIESVLGIMEAHSIHADSIDWRSLRTDTLERADGAETAADTYSAIHWAVSQLGDYHSMFLPSVDAQALRAAPVTAQSSPTGELLKGRIGHITLPGFAGSQEAAAEYASTLHTLICSLAGEGAKGWIVDLSVNSGGDSWAMLAGIGPILGEGDCGAFVDPTGRKEIWGYSEGAAHCGGETQVAVGEGAICSPVDASDPVAILTSGRTCSSGEMIAIAFIGRENARSFGPETCGLTTANEAFDLSDGAILLLTVSTFADRFGNVFGGRVTPDKIISAYRGPEATLSASVEWVRARLDDD